ncbi:MAG TPA: glycosyl transferase, partial [Dehalococcoidia bacterium]|nr:glycosyl transferase [Dehalococcoidia bacterium]
MRIAQVSYHTNPVAPLGGRHTGGMNVYVHELSRELAGRGHQVDIFTRLDSEHSEVTVLAPGLRLVQLPAGPPVTLEKELLTP